jgi:hypothetical protein
MRSPLRCGGNVLMECGTCDRSPLTLVLNYFGPDLIVQVSDRRLTYPDGTLADDESNKAVLWVPGMVFAYSGLARAPGQDLPTAEWLAESLKGKSIPDDVVHGLETDATLAFGRQCHQLFVGVGWGARDEEAEPCPAISVISNAYDEDGEWLEKANDRFRVEKQLLEPGYAGFAAHPPILTEDEVARLDAQVRFLVEQGSDPEEVTNTLIETVRCVADRSDLVGRSLLITCLPKAALDGPFEFAAARPSRERRSFLYIAADGETKRQYSPILVLDNVIMTGELFEGATMLSIEPPIVEPPDSRN